MNSRSISPPGTSFRSHGSRGGFSFSSSARISAASAIDLGAVARQGEDRVDLGVDLPGERRVAGNHAGARQRHVLPGPGLVALVLAEGLEMGGDRPLVAGRAQPEVELVEHALGGRRRDRRDQPLRQPREIVRRRERLCAVGLVGVRRRGRRAGSGRRRSPPSARGCRACPCRGWRPSPPARGRGGRANSASTAVERRADGEVGEVGEGLAGARRVDGAGEQAHADQEFLLGVEDAQPVERLLVVLPRARGRPARRAER